MSFIPEDIRAWIESVHKILEPDPELVEKAQKIFARHGGYPTTSSLAKAVTADLTPLFVNAEKSAGNLRYIRMITGSLHLRFPDLLEDAGRAERAPKVRYLDRENEIPFEDWKLGMRIVGKANAQKSEQPRYAFRRSDEQDPPAPSL